MPWHRSGEGLNRPVNIDTAKAYRGINVVSLWASAQARGFTTGTWGHLSPMGRPTVVRSARARSRASWSSTRSSTWKSGTTTPARAEHGKRPHGPARAGSSTPDQVDGYEAPALPEPKDPVATVAAADRFITATGAIIRHGGSRAFYRPSDDIIQMPRARTLPRHQNQHGDRELLRHAPCTSSPIGRATPAAATASSASASAMTPMPSKSSWPSWARALPLRRPWA